jgi:ABC-type phosphate/phosphonate transport system substrate-binding protein
MSNSKKSYSSAVTPASVAAPAAPVDLSFSQIEAMMHAAQQLIDSNTDEKKRQMWTAACIAHGVARVDSKLQPELYEAIKATFIKISLKVEEEALRAAASTGPTKSSSSSL